MADSIMLGLTFDLANTVRMAIKGVRNRIRASRNLGALATRCEQTIEQANGAIEELPEDNATKVTLGHIRAEITTLGDLVVEVDAAREKAGENQGCCAAFMGGGEAQKAEKRLSDCEGRIREHLTMLVQAAQLQQHAHRSSSIVSNPSARKFWDRHFHDDREVNLEAFSEALEHECRKAGVVSDQQLSDGISVVRQLMGNGKRPVSVIKFSETFSHGTIEDAVAQLSLKAEKKKGNMLCEGIVLRMPDREVDGKVHLGLIVVQEGESLRGVRHAIKAHFLDATSEDSDSEADDSDDEYTSSEYEFLRSGRFTFFLKEGQVKVRRQQEKDLADPDVTKTVWVARDDEVRTKRTIEVDADEVKVEVAGAAAPPSAGQGGDDDDDDDDIGEDIAERILRTAKMQQASDLSLEEILTTPDIFKAFKLYCVKKATKKDVGTNEESIVFLRDVSVMKQIAADTSLTIEKRCESVYRSAQKIMDRFFDDSTPMQLSGVNAAAVTASTNMIWKTLSVTYKPDQAVASGQAEAATAVLSGIFDSTFAQMGMSLNVKLLPAFRKALGKSLSVSKSSSKAASKKKIRVVIIGGGYTGVVCMRYLDHMSSNADKFHVTLIDPKEYFEDVTSQPMSICTPGKDANDPSGYWFTSVVPYKSGLLTNGSIVHGFVTKINSSQRLVEVGSDGIVVPYDYLVIASGTNYRSNIKTDNASMDYRMKQMWAEQRTLKRCDSVCVIGGGLVGLEISGEIAEIFKDCKVTLVSRSNKVLSRAPDEMAHKSAMARFAELGVEVILEDPMVKIDESLGEVTLKSGRVIEADKIYNATGYVPNTEFVKTDAALAAKCLDSAGFIKTDKYLRVVGGDGRIFAGGDCVEDQWFHRYADLASGKERSAERTAHMAFLQGGQAMWNVERAALGQPETDLIYLDQSKMAYDAPLGLISMGPSGGVLVGVKAQVDFLSGMLTMTGQDATLLGDGPDEGKACYLCRGTTPVKRALTTFFMSVFTPNTPSEAWLGFMASLNNYPNFVDPTVPPPEA